MEVEKLSGKTNTFKIIIENPKIHKKDFYSLFVKGPFGPEPADGYSSRGNGSVFHDISIAEGHAEMIVEDVRNQYVLNPVGFKLLFTRLPS